MGKDLVHAFFCGLSNPELQPNAQTHHRPCAMNKTDLIEKIKQLDGLTQDERATLIELVNTKKKYGLVWEDKPEKEEEKLRTQLPVLHEVVEKRILAEGNAKGKEDEHYKVVPLKVEAPDTLFPELEKKEKVVEETTAKGKAPNHILIEGDNLHALTALTFTHEGKIDVIYIDPPYNTGQENEFRYNDKWILKENPFKHSMWLNFISKRLKIAKRLLDEKGVIIIHIDENEFDALNLLLETEVFSNDAFLGIIVWNKQNPKGDAIGVANMHEYLLIYAKNKAEFASMKNALMRPKPNALKILNKAKRLFSKIGKTDIPEEIKEVIKPFNFSKEILEDFKVKYDLELINKEFQSWISRQDFSGGEKAYNKIDEHGKVYQSVSMAWPNKEQAPEDYFKPLIHPITGKECPVPARGWRNPPNTMNSLMNKGLILFGENEKTQPRRKYLLEENLYENTSSIYNNGTSDDELFKDLGIKFPYPKPVEVAAYFLKCIHSYPKIILDFFAGSGTTLHATMQLNAEDGGNRQCILVTNNENNICEEVTYERNRRVIQGYTNSKGQWVEGLSNNNLRYYKSEFVGREPSLKNKRELTRLATELLCIKEDCYTEHPVPFKHARMFVNDATELLIIYDDHVIPDAVEFIKTQINGTTIKVYVFSMGSDPYTEDFYEVSDKIELCALPDAIYKAYRGVLPKIKRQSEVITDETTEDESINHSL